MQFEYSIMDSHEIKKLSNDDEQRIIKDISNSFKNWDDLRSHQIKAYQKLKPEIYIEERQDYHKKAWKSDKKMNKIFSLFETRQAYLWENIYANVDKMFDVEGKDLKSSLSAKEQKSSLIDAFYKMKVNQQLDKAIEYLDSVGEFCLFTSWKSKYKQVRRPIKANTKNLIKDEVLNGIFNEKIYDGAYVEAINPINLVFEPESSPEIDFEWDKCGKIIKSFQSLEELQNSLSEKDFDELNQMVKKKNEDIKDETETLNDVFYQGKVEVLQYFGDYNFNGEVLKNYFIKIVARKFLIGFETNPFIVNPIINVASKRNPDTNRGIPCLYSIYDLTKSLEDDLNEIKDVQVLNKNPARFAPDNFFKEDEIEISPGKIIKYKQGIDDPNAIISIPIPLHDASNHIAYLDKLISDISGIYPNMQGGGDVTNSTATEIKVKVQGQSTRLAKDLDTIKQNGIIKMVENVADMLANENIGKISEIFEAKTGRQITITDEIRLGNYEYRYSDSNALANRQNKFNEALSLFTLASKDEALNQLLDKREILNCGLEMLGLDNTERFFIDKNQS